MAFPIPSHLPRKKPTQDISSKILSKLDDTPAKALNSAVASAWLTELDGTIQSTKEQIHERIQSSFPDFERQLSLSKSIQTRLRSLTNNVDVLHDEISNPETGLVPTLASTLSTHAQLAQALTDASIAYSSLAHLRRCRTEFQSLQTLVHAGNLPDAVARYAVLDDFISKAPEPLDEARVMIDLEQKFRAVRDYVEEQLSEAYSRSVGLSPTELIIRPSVQVRQSDTLLPLSSILSALSPSSFASHMDSLKRCLTTYYIDRILTQPLSVTISTSHSSLTEEGEHILTQYPAPPSDGLPTARLENLSNVLSFLHKHLFPFLPVPSSFPRSLAKPITSALLQHLLIPSLPSSLQLLPPFLSLLSRAVDFEQQHITGTLGCATTDNEIGLWADGVSGHYERKRRMEVLESARVIILDPSRINTFHVEAETLSQPLVVATQETPKPEIEPRWGLNEKDAGSEENGWGFDDDEGLEPDAGQEDEKEEDLADPWGWNEDESNSSSSHADQETAPETAWDDPWGDDSELASSTQQPLPLSPRPSSTLERQSAGKENGDLFSANGQSHPSKLMDKRPPELTIQSSNPRETYVVSERTQAILTLVNDVLKEGVEFSSSTLFQTSSHGTLLLQSALEIIDLQQALYRVTSRSELALSSARSMVFSNDCIYMSTQISSMKCTVQMFDQIKEKLAAYTERLKFVGDSWFNVTIEKQQQAVRDVLVKTEGFAYTADQDRYDECESAMSKVMRDIRTVAHQWKGVLAKSKYYAAVGLVVNSALSQILEEILALPDIPAVESHRLSELCKILNALEGLFVEDPQQPSFVVAYVPSWLKYSYLSELLEASIADISYLFEEGALVDFEVDELVMLVRALFADTPLRASTINKLLNGHPER